ncbi:hypothetical protein FJ444_13240 [Aestuariibacter sp. GS-14]|uniref:hypothetical protein n=1 Tax=Aestuariibacter sp. GS-14 TaxID=2590670 RepID=UPI00112B3628|nr:hypothetical protein [Aestuariibacter sp. GS-14]TPV57353.1 hypothetical protein FJ444_13240 [Aestuariibacter sp. GS-14]
MAALTCKHGLKLSALSVSLLAGAVSLSYSPVILATVQSLPVKEVAVDKTWVISQDVELATLVLHPGAKVIRPGKSVTMLVDGIETTMKTGTYHKVQLRVSDKFSQSPAGKTARGVDNFRAALYVNADGVNEAHSIEQAVISGTFDATLAKDIQITSASPNFNGIMVDGPVIYRIENATLNFRSQGDGSDVSDFAGYGAPVAAYNGARLVVDNSTIHSSGVGRLAVFSYEDADVMVSNSTLSADGGQLYEGYANSADFSLMVAPPWVLGIKGTARTTNMMGNKTSFTLVNSSVTAANWGVVSTDLGEAMLLTIVDSTLTLNGHKDPFSAKYGSGYGTYILGSEQFYYGATINAGTYGGIIRNGKAYYGSSRFSEPLAIYPRDQLPTGKTQVDFFGIERPVYDVKPAKDAVFTGITGKGQHSRIISDNFGWMAHGDGDITLDDGTEVNSGKSTFLLKEGNINIQLQGGVKLNPADGILVQLMDNDDMLVGLQQDSQVELHFNTTFSEPAGFAGLDYPVTANNNNSTTVTVNTEQVELVGDMFNGTGYFGGQSGDNLHITLGKDTSLTGRISATTVQHINEKGEQVTHFTESQYYYLGHVANRIFNNGHNQVQVTMESGSSWHVTGKSVLHSLTIKAGAKLSGDNLRLIVNGQAVAVKPGEFKGEIVLQAG